MVVGDYREIMSQEIIPADSYVIIAGFNHEEDYEILKALYEAQWKPRYIGLLASRNKGRVIVDKLKKELGPDIDLGILYSPVGLELGGESPGEIAISILSEIQALRHQKNSNKHLSESWPTS